MNWNPRRPLTSIHYCRWHLGFCNWACVPTRRGFDTFYGIYGGSGDKYTHRTRSSDKSNAGFDFRDDEKVVRNVRNQYTGVSVTCLCLT